MKHGNTWGSGIRGAARHDLDHIPSSVRDRGESMIAVVVLSIAFVGTVAVIAWFILGRRHPDHRPPR